MTTTIKKRKTKKTELTFSLLASGAQQVRLAGDFTNWERNAIPLQRNGGYLWRANVKLEPGEYQYRFIVDGKWQEDPANALRVPNAFGIFNSLLRVG